MKKITLLAPVFFATAIHAVNYAWLGAEDSNWQNPANWEAPPGMMPCGTNLDNDVLYIRNRPVNGSPLEYTDAEGVTFINAFKIQNGDFIVNGGTLVLTNTSDTVSAIGSFNHGGTLTINAGAVQSANYEALYVSENGPSNAVFNINGGEFNIHRFDLRGGGRNGMTTTVNLNGGVLGITQPMEIYTDPAFTNCFNFNGGLLKGNGTWAYSPANNYTLNGNPIQIRDGGAKIEAYYDCIVSRDIRHSNIPGDNPVDGGLEFYNSVLRPLVLMGTNTYTGATVLQYGILRFPPASNHAFFIKADGSVNDVTLHDGQGQFQGVFNIVPESKPFVYTSWQLVTLATAATAQYAPTFGLEMDGVPFEDRGGGVFKLRDYAYDTATGVLTRKPLATLLFVK